MILSTLVILTLLTGALAISERVPDFAMVGKRIFSVEATFVACVGK